MVDGIDCHGELFTKQRHNLVPGSSPPVIDHSSSAKEERGNFLRVLLDDNVVGFIKGGTEKNTILVDATTSQRLVKRCGGIDASSIKVFTVVGRSDRLEESFET